MAKILIVEDDAVLASLISDWLIGAGYDVESIQDGMEAAHLLKLGGFDMIVLDWDLPGKNGIDILREFRSGGGKAPVIMLTAKNMLADKEQGLDIGADDYVTKPFAMKELAARIRAVMRRPTDVVLSDVLRSGDLALDLNSHRLTKGGVEVHLQPRDFALLEFFMRHPNQIFSADVLLARVWSSESEASIDALRTSIKRVRRAIDGAGQDDSNSIIKTIPKLGYTFRSD